jgi:transcriptional regulator GlxA family with amidase domain
MAQRDFRGQYADEVQEILGAVYSENEFRIDGGKQQSRTRLYGVDAGDVAQYNISFSSPFTCVSQTERDWYLVLSCTAGNANFSQGGSSIDFSRGRVAPISTASESSMRGGNTFAHISTLISTRAINEFCANLLGHPIDQPVQFDLSPFSDELKAYWRLVVRSLNQLLDAQHLPTAAIRNLNEYAIALLLQKHPHNYSEQLLRRQPIGKKTVQDARRYIEENAGQSIGIGDVAAFFQCSVAALNEGFCEYLGLTPRAYLYFARMALVKTKITNGGEGKSAGEIAQRCGFANLKRFEAAYTTRYDESPNESFHPSDRSNDGEIERDLSGAKGALPPAKVELLRHHINAALGDRITVDKLASTIGMSTQSFAASFKRTFNATPAQYVLTERLKWARWLLANTGAGIGAIAAETGFSSQSHLTTTLKRWNGQTPHELRMSSRLE